ncbi:NADP-dependent oxidoreductase [Alkalicoccobacillus murimartini]|uniref:NADPH-dependent curcumin reductase CurA n=1 Tax=Alkalicoccobacillus murimartini TaxID=171685 RepID=A0ABT9YEK1_9BACI|nr:NADP-dependent oxidoreductase [Alkalicoccobacillus murimartini]MDQ0205484.1 NADPH-dependent curcumin reductase CurA [Alkalicoccobacillus murimartini]
MQKQLQLQERPNGLPDEHTFSTKEIEIGSPNDNELLVKTLYLSVDPYMRGRMSDAKSYIAPFELNQAISGGSIAEVIESNVSSIPKGTIVSGLLPFQEYVVVKPDQVRTLEMHGAPISAALGALGMPGLTAYFGLDDIGKPKEGETVVISGAAGAVGSIAGQLARLKGARAVGIVGSQEKVDFLVNELGFSAAINYKEDNMEEALKQACPDGIDVYFENVGGEVSDHIWPLLNPLARIPVCGAISAYNLKKGEKDSGPRVQTYLVKTRARMQGFLYGDYADQYEKAYSELSEYVKNKEIVFKETILDGFDRIPEAFNGLFTGKNIGKQLVKISDPS